jgi:transposase
VQNSLTVSNVMLSSVVSDTFGKSSLAILSHLLKHPDDKDFDFLPLLHGSMLKKKDDFALAIDGTISKAKPGKKILCLSHMDKLKSYIAQIEETALQLATPYLSAIEIIKSVPGISLFSALAILSEIGANMSAFHTSNIYF